MVMLASFLVHAGDVEVRRGMLDTCRRHVADEGLRVDPARGRGLPHEPAARAAWTRAASPSGSCPRSRSGTGSNSVRAEYVFPDAAWTQTFLARPLTKEQFEEALAEAGAEGRPVSDGGPGVGAGGAGVMPDRLGDRVSSPCGAAESTSCGDEFRTPHRSSSVTATAPLHTGAPHVRDHRPRHFRPLRAPPPAPPRRHRPWPRARIALRRLRCCSRSSTASRARCPS